MVGHHSLRCIQVQAKQMKTENVRILVRVQELPDINYKISDINALKLTKKEMVKDYDHFWKLFEDMDGQLFF